MLWKKATVVLGFVGFVTLLVTFGPVALAALALVKVSLTLSLLKLMFLGSLKSLGVGAGALCAPAWTTDQLRGACSSFLELLAEYFRELNFINEEELGVVKQSFTILARATRRLSTSQARSLLWRFIKKAGADLLKALVQTKNLVLGAPGKIWGWTDR